MTPEDPRHGSEAGHEQHCRDGESACTPCYEAKLKGARRRTKRKTMGYKYTVPADRARAQLETWRDGGATYGEIADHTGVEESRIWEILNDNSPRIYTRTARAILSAHGWPVTAEGVTRRVRALCRLGWSIPRIADLCGVHHDTVMDIRRRRPEFVSRKVRAAIVAGYETAAMQIPQATGHRDQAGITRARRAAEQQGWMPPMAWEDIDDPTERPNLADTNDRIIDHAAIERVLAGDLVPTNRAERVEITRRWEALGRSLGALERLTSWKSERYTTRGDAA